MAELPKVSYTWKLHHLASQGYIPAILLKNSQASNPKMSPMLGFGGSREHMFKNSPSMCTCMLCNYMHLQLYSKNCILPISSDFFPCARMEINLNVLSAKKQWKPLWMEYFAVSGLQAPCRVYCTSVKIDGTTPGWSGMMSQDEHQHTGKNKKQK